MRIVDLSWPVAPGMPMFPGDPPVAATPMGSLEADGFVSQQWSLPAHSGTHMDAPAHVLANGAPLAALPLGRFAGAGVVLDVRARPGLAVTEADLLPLLTLADGAAFVLLSTGDAERWGDPAYYTAGAYLTLGAARLLAGVPGLSGIGLDAGSVDSSAVDPSAVDPSVVDPFSAAALPAHHALLSAGLVIVENLRGLEALPLRGFTFLCLPVFGADGSPVRAAALVDQECAE